MREVLVMTASDLRQRVRDRTVLIFALLVPLGLMTVFNFVFTGVTSDLEIEPVTLVVSVPADDELAEELLEAVRSTDVVQVTVEEAGRDEVGDSVASGDADLGLVVPAAFSSALRAGEEIRVEVHEGDEAGLGTDIVLSTVEAVLGQLHAGAVAAQAAAVTGVPPGELGAVAQDAVTAGPAIEIAQGEAATEQLSAAGAVVVGQTGLFLLFTVSFGVLSLLAEREQGTLARLSSMPIRPRNVVLAKALSGFALGVVASAVLLTVGSLMFDVDLGSPPAVALVVLAAVAAATSLTFVVARVARTAEQAQIGQSVIAMVLGIAGGAFFPIATSGSVGRLLDLNPVAALTRGLGITSGGGGVADLGGVLLTLALFALCAAAASVLLPDRGGGR